MTLPGHVFTALDGVRGFDTAEPVSAKAAAAFHRHGYRFCVRYVRRDKPHASALSAKEAKWLLNAGIGLMLVQYVESDTSWIPSGAKGAANGAVAAAEAEKLGVPFGVTVWCDLEGVKRGTRSQKVIDYCNQWHIAVMSAGYLPGLYVGYHAGLNPTQLYRSLRFSHYWGAYNLNSDQYPAVRGLQLVQSLLERHWPTILSSVMLLAGVFVILLGVSGFAAAGHNRLGRIIRRFRRIIHP